MKQMYKVFLNDRIIVIGGNGNITINKPSVTFHDNCTAGDVRAWFNDFEASDLMEIYLVHNNPEKFFSMFQSAFMVVHAAGGVVCSGNRLLFILRNGKWDLPKGKLNKDELAEEAAMREVEEETGITPEHIDSRLPSTFHIYKSPYKKDRNQWIFKETFWFQMSYSGELQGSPQHEEGIMEVKWFERNRLDEVFSNTYENLKQIITLYCG